MSWRDKCRWLPIHPDECSQGRLVTSHRLAVIFLAFAPSAESPDNGLRSWTWQLGGAKRLPVGQTVTKRGILWKVLT